MFGKEAIDHIDEPEHLGLDSSLLAQFAQGGLDRAFAGIVADLDPDGTILATDLDRERAERGAHRARVRLAQRLPGDAADVVRLNNAFQRVRCVLNSHARHLIPPLRRAWCLALVFALRVRDDAQVARLAKYHGDKARWVLNAWTDTWLHPGFATWSLEGVLPRVTCPTLVIHGEHDEYGSLRHPEMIGERSGGPAQVEIIAGAYHVPHREKPELIVQMVADFVRDME
mgnify:CR=1 FL=1